MQMKQMLASWRSFNEQEYPQYVHLIPHPNDIDLSNIDNGGVMTDTWNSAQKANRLVSDSFNSVIHSMFFHNHLCNVWVNNVLDSLSELLRAHLNDSLEEVAPEFRVSPVFMSLSLSFEKCLVSVQTVPRVLARYFVNVRCIIILVSYSSM